MFISLENGIRIKVAEELLNKFSDASLRGSREVADTHLLYATNLTKQIASELRLQMNAMQWVQMTTELLNRKHREGFFYW
ncbi:hypothetical protein A2363_04695 [Candidatus Gottesmanbacteria bacterium RIFOXYB1_FULL_47_11]|uniref:Uncharacterized protein n=1 Tax=Candidatus Gottesmanbacteria bacterium RIFOXYB1_FULL_47_11 TaxID=1798401 RepID=A0A1F6BG48_9BACT|nr:MAG: hypothetical protein A2363_04695 [Candidatus Gottesmanbacteria bacterium RIFOXYB1_FULL_47_11]